MDFNWNAEEEAFRHELRSWLEANVPKDRRNETGVDFMHEEGGDWQRRLAWHKKAHAAGWVGISWPKEYGGRGANLVQQIIYNEEMGRANAPALVNGLGIMLVGPTIIHWGT
ncbi:MAG TPA: acyl-CoA dehydrogenase family protein, partial [Candidatus Binataceae bacterium]|nr:acyl-CoA dehydrogenase family protein [Candidatus Binataceae bacterium]